MTSRRASSRKATKRKTSKTAQARNKEVAPEHELPSGFWRQIVAVVLLVLAVVMIFAWLGDGGPILNAGTAGLMWLIGYAEYLVPVLLVWLAVKIFRSEDNRLPVVMWIASGLMVIWMAGLVGLPTIGAAEPTGGLVGEWLNDIMTQIVAPGVAVFIYIVLMFVTGIFILQTNPLTVFRAIGRLFHIREKEDKQNERVAAKAEGRHSDEGLEIAVNSGVAIDEAPVTKPVKGKVTAAKAAEAEPERALVAVNDPNWKMPSLDLLEKKQSPANPGNIQQNAQLIKETLAEFGIDVEMEGANVGPRVTQYTMRPPAGVNLSKIMARDRELALNLAVDKIRIEAPIPGTRLVGVEIPNAKSADVRLRGVLESPEWKKATEPLVFAVGKDISGKSVVANLAKMPHLLIAGTTGSGKSVMTNTLITSLLYRNAPSDLKLIIVDPKQVEMAQYDGIPHLLTPVITQTEKALSALRWAVDEMEKRYTLMAQERVKNIVDYNAKMAKKAVEGGGPRG